MERRRQLAAVFSLEQDMTSFLLDFAMLFFIKTRWGRA